MWLEIALGVFMFTAIVVALVALLMLARTRLVATGEAALADYVPSNPRNFPDVTTGFWAYKHIEYCVEDGVVQGYPDGRYYPSNVVTRDQMAVYVARAFGLTG